MRHKCKFDPKKDYVKATPNLSVNLSKAMENGIVPQSGTLVEHNGMEHSTDIGPRVQDSFEAIDLQRNVMAVGKAQVKADADAAAAQAAAQAAVQAAVQAAQ